MALNSRQRMLLIVLFLSIGMWIVPYLQPALLPLIYLNTHVHEMAHALAGLASGGSVDYIAVYPNGSGQTLVRGGSPLLVASAGYVGSSIAGAAMLLWGATRKGAKQVLWLTIAVLVFAMVFFVRGHWVGWVSGIGWIFVLTWIVSRWKKESLVFAAQFLGMQQCFMSLYAFLGLMQVTALPQGHSDARLLEDATNIPAMTWVLAWMALSGIIVILGLVRSW